MIRGLIEAVIAVTICVCLLYAAVAYSKVYLCQQLHDDCKIVAVKEVD